MGRADRAAVAGHPRRSTGRRGKIMRHGIRSLPHYALLACIGLMIGLSPSSGAQGQKTYGHHVRDDPLDASWIWGNLTWTPEGGRIVWGPIPEGTQDPGGRPFDSGKDSFNFTSDPFPRLAVLNASRLLHVDLAIPEDEERGACGGQQYLDSAGNVRNWKKNGLLMAVDIFVGGKRLASAHPGHRIEHLGPWPHPDPPGHRYCSYRIPIELDSIERGAIVQMQWHFDRNGNDLGAGGGEGRLYRFGAGPDHESTIKIGAYSAADAFWRSQPEENGLDADKPTTAPLIPELIVPGLASLLFLAPQRKTTRGMRVVAIFVLLTGGLAGCLNLNHEDGATEKTPLVGSFRADQVPFENETKGDGQNGTIRGRVFDSSFIPVQGAHVNLLRTPHYARTDPYGQFEFLNLPPGLYRLRVDKTGFSSFEAEVAVSAAQVTRLEISIEPAGGLTADFRSHRHDYWGAETQHLVLNQTMGWCPPKNSLSNRACAFPYEWSIPPDESPSHNIVLPGTRLVEVTLDWDSSRLGETLGLAVQANEDPSPHNLSFYTLRGPRQPFLIQTNWEMTDTGHQLFSTWRFSILKRAFTTNNPFDPLGMEGAPALSVKIVIHRGIVPLEPPHPDHWGQETQRVVDQGKSWTLRGGHSTIDRAGNYGCWYGEDYNETFGLLFGKINDFSSLYSHFIPWGSPASLIPHQTERVKFIVNFSQPSTSSIALASYEWQLWYKPGNAPIVQMQRGSPFLDAGPATRTGPGGSSLVWDVTLSGLEADGIYSRRTVWSYFMIVDDQRAACAEALLHSSSGEGTTAELTVIAHKRPDADSQAD